MVLFRVLVLHRWFSWDLANQQRFLCFDADLLLPPASQDLVKKEHRQLLDHVTVRKLTRSSEVQINKSD
jgi:hypothetical protein